MQPRIAALGLKTHRLTELQRFYGDIIGFPAIAHTEQSITFAAGATRLTFEQVTDGSEPYYHVAFNIPENKLAEAKAWLSKCAPLLLHAETGDDVIEFPAWDAHSLFFYDPAGSLIELIARHTLPNATDHPFTVQDILYVSEIGLVPPEQAPVFTAIRDAFNLPTYQQPGSFLGDEYGIIIIVPHDRRWIPEFKKTGMLCPTYITLRGHGVRRLEFSDLPFTIEGIE